MDVRVGLWWVPKYWCFWTVVLEKTLESPLDCKDMSIKSVTPSNHLILCCPLLLPPLILPSIRVFSNKSVLHIKWPKYWSFIFNISPSNEYSGLVSFRMDWLDVLALQGTLKSLLQQFKTSILNHISKASILWPLSFFMAQLSHPYMTTIPRI